MKISFILLLIGHYTSADYNCLCDIEHSDITIRECPANNAKIIGFMYASDNNDNFHGIQDTSEAHCKGLVPNIYPPPGWTAVYHFNKIGFITVDAGDRTIPCKGDLQKVNWTIGDNCAYLTSTPTITTPQTANIPATTWLILTAALGTRITAAPTKLPQSTSTTAAPTTPRSTSTTAASTTHISTSTTAASTTHRSTSTTAASTTHRSTSTTAPPTTPRSTSTTAASTTHRSTSTTAPPTTHRITSTTAPPTTHRITSTTAAPTTHRITSTTAAPTTPPIIFHMCDKLGIILDLGKHESIEHHNARPCDNGNFHSEAILMKHCGMPNPKNTTKGLRVLDHCQDIPLYTPISMFVGNQYLGLNAVFFRCENAHSMTIISQNCDVPKVEIIDTQNGAELYYTIHWSTI